VPIAAASRSASAASATGPSSAAKATRSRSRRSVAAFSVKVTAATRASGTPLSTTDTTRFTSEVVLPDPAPASTNSVSSRSARIESRAG
jgi:hypothetical protein